ncbi:hypothetical protein [Streptomyces sp. NPDC085932]|uniref:hypothetical protein n=1 Tax=Streptomyces sp. NPDC085932 TaxID=3365741 RepID=UPI0037CD21BD
MTARPSCVGSCPARSGWVRVGGDRIPELGELVSGVALMAETFCVVLARPARPVDGTVHRGQAVPRDHWWPGPMEPLSGWVRWNQLAGRSSP